MVNQSEINVDGGQQSNAGPPQKKKSQKVLLIAIIAILVLAVIVAGSLFYINRQDQPEQNNSPGSSTSTSSTSAGDEAGDYETEITDEDEFSLDNYPTIDFVTPEMQSKYNDMYRTQGIQAVVAEVEKDFLEHGTEFNWGNPHHTKVLSFPEEY